MQHAKRVWIIVFDRFVKLWPSQFCESFE